MTWTEESLQSLVQTRLGEYQFFVVSNRQPYVHVFNKGKVEVRRGVGGVISALEPVMQACGGMWIAASDGEADRQVSDHEGRIRVPVENPKYTLKRLSLSKEEEQGYYHGFSNSALWPLCHMAYKRPIFNEEHWSCYRKVNERFAEAILSEAGDRKSFIWIQDYHLCLLPKILKDRRPDQFIIAHFWHIPWPGYETFRVCPQKTEILEGLLANDLLGFHIRYHCLNFLDVIDREIECKIDRERMSVIRNQRETLVRPYPISIDYEAITEQAESPEVLSFMEALREEHKLTDKKVLVGLDRIDYTKGIPEKLQALDLLLDAHPELVGKIVLLQIGVISRLHVREYKQLNEEINVLIEEINWKHAKDGWKPIIFIRQHLTQTQLLGLYRLSDVGIVSSLHDGMNLVAKEYVAGTQGCPAMLVLSQFTGAAREFTDAVLINPYDRKQFSAGIYEALCLSQDDKSRRMNKMRTLVQDSNIYRWASKIINELLKLEFKP